jgi:hypothetical protein
MESNCKVWFHKVKYMMNGFIDPDNDNELFVLVPNHGGQSLLPIDVCIFHDYGYTIYPG